jgi:hypothetical protein
MSRITLAPNASGTGTLTVAAPNTNTDRTITLPDVTTTLVGTDATQTLTNKSIDASQLSGNVAADRITGALNATGSAPIYACRAWVNFNGTGTVAIRGSGNVSSITDGGVGIYTVNFTTAMPDANYSVVASSHFSATATRGSVFAEPYASTASSCVVVTSASASSFDCASVTVAIFR